jgi:ABC-type transport system involved in cytochrome c biogenesis permease subunit
MTHWAVQTAAITSRRRLTVRHKDDWFLGSIGEMMLMYTNLRQAGVGGFSTGYYWSSSERDQHAWDQDFNYGIRTTTTASSTRLRASSAGFLII